MDRQEIPFPTNEIRFLLSLLHIANPGQPPSEQSEAIEELLSNQTNR